MLALSFLVLVIFIARNSGSVIRLPEINAQLSDRMIFIVGLLTGFHCAGMCGSFILGYTTIDAERGRSPFACIFSMALAKAYPIQCLAKNSILYLHLK